MSHAIIARVKRKKHFSQKLIFYVKTENGLRTFSESDAKTLVGIFNLYPHVFSNIEAIPSENSQIRLIDIRNAMNDPRLVLEKLQDECENIVDLVEEAIEPVVVGIEWE